MIRKTKKLIFYTVSTIALSLISAYLYDYITDKTYAVFNDKSGHLSFVYPDNLTEASQLYQNMHLMFDNKNIFLQDGAAYTITLTDKAVHVADTALVLIFMVVSHEAITDEQRKIIFDDLSAEQRGLVLDNVDLDDNSTIDFSGWVYTKNNNKSYHHVNIFEPEPGCLLFTVMSNKEHSFRDSSIFGDILQSIKARTCFGIVSYWQYEKI